MGVTSLGGVNVASHAFSRRCQGSCRRYDSLETGLRDVLSDDSPWRRPYS